MKNIYKEFDAIVIGAGIFGLYTADYLSSKGFKVAVLEKEAEIFNRASRVNQSRVHRGYHYPRSLTTATKVAEYYQQFCDEFSFALLKPFKEYYAVAKEGSKITAQEFSAFCNRVNIPLKEVETSRFFKEDKIEATFEVDEACFNFLKIKDYFLKKISSDNNIKLFCNTEIKTASKKEDKYLLSLKQSNQKLLSKLVINTTYGGINEVNKIFGFNKYDLKFELCELTVCKTQSPLIKNKGVIVMDGPFFSVMPFENGDLVSLYSVNHAPIHTSHKRGQFKKYYSLTGPNRKTAINKNSIKMFNQAKSYLRDDIDLEYNSSIYEIRPIFNFTEEDDSRPTVITKHSSAPHFYSILSGKISTIYDVRDELNLIIK